MGIRDRATSRVSMTRQYGMGASRQLSAVSYQLSAISYQLLLPADCS